MKEEFDFKKLLSFIESAVPIEGNKSFNISQTANALPDDKYYIINGSAIKRMLEKSGHKLNFLER